MAFGFAMEFSFDVLSPGVGLTFRVPDAFMDRAEDYAERVREQSELWLRGYARQRAVPAEILSWIEGDSLVEVEWGEGSLRIKLALSLAGLLVLVAGCRNSPRPTYREECSMALKQLAGVATQELGSNNMGESQEPEVHFGKLGDIDQAFERWKSRQIDARELAELLESALTEISERNETTVLLEHAIYLNNRYQRELEELDREMSEVEIRYTFEHRLIHEVRPRPGTTTQEVMQVIASLKEMGYEIETAKEKQGLIEFILTGTYNIVSGIGGFIGGLVVIAGLIVAARKRILDRLKPKAEVKQQETPAVPPPPVP